MSSTIDFEQVMDMWEADSKIDITEPGKVIAHIPTLHAKYARILSSHSLGSKRCTFEYAKLKKVKWEYYNGRLDKDDLDRLGWEPFKFVLKSDLNTYMESDADLSKIMQKKAYHDEVVAFCTHVLKELNNRTWQVKEFMGWEKFILGQG